MSVGAQSAMAHAGKQSSQVAAVGPATTIAGNIYVSQGDSELGLGSYHFLSEVEAYISYENERCAKVYPRLDQRARGSTSGERVSRKMPFRETSYDPRLRIFRGMVTFSRDMGTYEEVLTIDGIEREDYELVFAQDFDAIVDGVCKSYAPNASKPHRVDRFGTDICYLRWVQQEGLAQQQQREETPCAAFQPVSALSARARLQESLLARDIRTLGAALEALEGSQADVAEGGFGVDAAEVWKSMKWDPGLAWHAAPPLHTPALVAAILLAWPAGVELCVRRCADVNFVYTGPFRCSGASGALPPPQSNPVLHVALSVRGPAQCLICRHLLDGRVDFKVFQRVRKKCQDQMEVDTRALFDRWLGPVKQSSD